MGRAKGIRNKGKSVVDRYFLLPSATNPEERYIPLTQGQYAIVDGADFDWLNQWNWCALWMPRQQKFYAVRSECGPDGKWKSVLMHRAILACPEGMTVDHADRSGLNNRRQNLRMATYSQQNCNRLDSRGSSRFKGVSWESSKNKWRARVKLHGKEIWARRFDTEEEAAEAYRKKAEEIHGTFALTAERPSESKCL